MASRPHQGARGTLEGRSEVLREGLGAPFEGAPSPLENTSSPPWPGATNFAFTSIIGLGFNLSAHAHRVPREHSHALPGELESER